MIIYCTNKHSSYELRNNSVFLIHCIGVYPSMVNMMQFGYRKNPSTFFDNPLEQSELLGITNVQNYVPLYNNFFRLNDSNHTIVTLDNTEMLTRVTEMQSYNRYTGSVCTPNGGCFSRNIFFKFSPLLDPLKYMTGKYDSVDINSFPDFLPNISDISTVKSHPKMMDKNNMSYVDGFFTYLTSKLLHSHGFIHGVDYYGSFMGNKQLFEVDIRDDIEYLENSDFFHENNGSIFNLNNNDVYEQIQGMNNTSRKHKRVLIIQQDDLVDSPIDIPVDEEYCTSQEEQFDINQSLEKNDRKYTIDMTEINPINNSTELSCSISALSRSYSVHSDDTECSSGSSVTNDDASDDASDNSCSGSESNYESDDDIICTISEFPVLAIAMEACDGTLDELFVNENLSQNRQQLRSAIFQIIMTLVVFQKSFGMTHNDLHTNNIVYCATDIKYLFYKYNSKYYRVPTFGRIFKIIDFGRSIYNFRGKSMCSDSYHPSGDAGSQYNCEPFFNASKPRLDPHFGFDLARLGCALYELVDAEEFDDCGNIIEEKLGDLEQMIVSWCRDDKGRNILYKSDGEERYPGFKLYKMIARTSHNHLPTKEINNPVFDMYHTTAKKINNKDKLMNVDTIPDYTKVWNTNSESGTSNV